MLKKMNKCTNLFLLQKYGIDKLLVICEQEKVERLLTPEGVFKYNKDKAYTSIYLNRYSDNIQMIKLDLNPLFDNQVICGSNVFTIYYNALTISRSFVRETIELKESPFVIAKFQNGKIIEHSSKYVDRFCNQTLELKELLINNVDKIDPTINNQIIKNLDAMESFFGKENFLDINTINFYNAYNFFAYNIFTNFSHKDYINNIGLFNYLANKTYSNTEYVNNILNLNKTEISISKLIDICGFPQEIDTKVIDKIDMLYPHNALDLDKYKWNKISEDTKNILLSLLYHNTISYNCFARIANNYSTIKTSDLPYINKFLIKYSILYGDNVLYVFNILSDLLYKENLDKSLILNIKKIGYIKAMIYLRDHKFNNERIDAFGNLIDINPDIAMDLLKSKGHLKKDELKKIDEVLKNRIN